MHVMEIVSGAEVNGAIVHCLLLSRALAERGHTVTLVCRPGAWIAAQPVPPSVHVVASDLHRWPTDELRRMTAMAHERGVDVLHTHMSRAHFFGVLLRSASGVPSVATAHSQHFQLHWMFNDRVIAVSQATAAFHRRWNAVRRTRLDVVHNFVDTARYTAIDLTVGAALRVEWCIDREHPVIGIIGDVVPRKGLADLLHAVAALRETIPNVRLLVVGHLHDRYAQETRTLSGALGLTERVVWAGYRNDIPAVLSAIDVVACPSHHDDLAMASLEAMAAGRPVVATTVGGFPECIVDGVTGLLVPPRDPRQLAAALGTLLSDVARRTQMGRAAATHIRENFSAARQVPHIEAVLARAVADRQHAARRRRSPWHASR